MSDLAATWPLQAPPHIDKGGYPLQSQAKGRFSRDGLSGICVAAFAVAAA